MRASIPHSDRRAIGRAEIGWTLLLALAGLLWLPTLTTLWGFWRGDPTLSHGPLIPAIAAAHLWMRRKELRRWESASLPGLALLLVTTLLHVGAVWADIAFLKPLSLIGMTAGVVWFLGGRENFRVLIGTLGFLVFMIPWPTVLTERLAFPLQLTSSAYAALFGGILGLPIHREGVYLSVVPDLDVKPIYTILVARQCSGLSSLTVLLALAYLVAYHTPVGFGRRAAIVIAVVPLALLMNAVRLTLVLLVGAHYSAALAQVVHDHEAPFLIFLCSLGLLGLRTALLAWRPSALRTDGTTIVQAPTAGR